jgi:very-short-patch-repair endonuclease
MLGPIPITTPIRTLIDIAGRLEDIALSGLLERTIRDNLVDPERLRARISALRSSGRHGCGRLEALLARRGVGPAMESTLEALVWSLILSSGVRLPERQYWATANGHRCRLDFAWPDLGLALECDGREHHGSNRIDFVNDRARYAELLVAGISVLPVTWDAARNQPARVIGWLRDRVPLAP